MRKNIVLLVLAFLLTIVSYCFAEGDTTEFSNDGLMLSIPAEIAGQLVVETPEKNDEGILFSVSEKASIEAAEKSGYSADGAGWLFSIGRVDEEKYHDMLCEDMIGVIVFAKDDNDSYYMFYHPTDVRLFREENNYSEENLEKWSELNSWAYSMRDTFTEDNGLTPEKHGNTELDIFLARLMYRDNENYTVSTTEYGPVEPNGVKAADFIEPLVNGAVFERQEDEAPDGEYVVLSFPDYDIRFDFFLMEGKENYIRQVWSGGQFETLYLAEFTDPNLKASGIMHDLYLAMVQAGKAETPISGMANPWTTTDAEGLVQTLGLKFNVPEGAEDVVYRMNVSEKLAEMRFVLNGMPFTARIKPAALEMEDISGLHYKWDVEEEESGNHWTQEKHMKAKDGDETVEAFLWFDIVPGLTYSISTKAPDLDGFDIVAIAQQVWHPVQGDN